MVKFDKTEVLYRFMEEYLRNARTKATVLHEKHSPYKNYSSTANFLRESFDKKIILKPIIYCNSGLEVELLSNLDDPFTYLEECKKDKSITKIVTLCGEYSILYFKKGATLLTYSEAIKPTLYSDFSICDIDLNEKGELKVDPSPKGWDELDWRVYDLMRDPDVSYPTVSAQLNDEGFDVTWKTISNRYNKIADFCKVNIGFFPEGRDSYSETFLTFKTEFEIDLRNELKRLDRTSYLYKYGDVIMLNLFLDSNKEHYYFMELQKEGKIKDLKVSIPIWHSSSFDND
jgi:hypothetical protein